jgi:hypothetical protein
MALLPRGLIACACSCCCACVALLVGFLVFYSGYSDEPVENSVRTPLSGAAALSMPLTIPACVAALVCGQSCVEKCATYPPGANTINGTHCLCTGLELCLVCENSCTAPLVQYDCVPDCKDTLAHALCTALCADVAVVWCALCR